MNTEMKLHTKITRMSKIMQISAKTFFKLMSSCTSQSHRDDIIKRIKKEGFVLQNTFYSEYAVKTFFDELEPEIRLKKWKNIRDK